MKAADIMTRQVITAGPGESVVAIAAKMSENRISAVPIVDAGGGVIGIVSEGDLMRRNETGTERRRGWWLLAFAESDTLAAEFVKAHGRKAADIMTREVVSVHEQTSVADIVERLERHRIKRVPVVRDGKLVGIVSRANLVRLLATQQPSPVLAADDRAIRERLVAEFERRGFQSNLTTNVSVAQGVVQLSGFYASEIEHKALHIAAEEIPGVREVVDSLTPRPAAFYRV